MPVVVIISRTVCTFGTTSMAITISHRARIKLRAIRTLIFALLPALLISAASNTAPSPTAVVQASVSGVIDALSDNDIDNAARWQKISALLRAAFNFHSMSRSILATKWSSASAQEQDAIADSFADYLVNTFKPRLAQYAGEGFEIADESVAGDRAIVDTYIVTTAGQKISVSFALRQSAANWRAYDVVIEGVSLVSHFRDRFANVTRKDGIDGLLAHIRSAPEPF